MKTVNAAAMAILIATFMLSAIHGVDVIVALQVVFSVIVEAFTWVFGSVNTTEVVPNNVSCILESSRGV